MTKQQFLIALSLLATLILSQPAFAVSPGENMPECALSPIKQGQNTNLSHFKGKVTYVDFWASWCGPCAKSFPFLNEMHQQFKDKGLQIVGVNLDENLEDAQAFLETTPANFIVMADVSKDCAKTFDVKAMPSSYIVDKQGKVHHVHLGFKSGEADEIKTLIEKLLN